jgi:Phosphatidylinositol N-acetylglucosaminyltransferase
MRVKSCLWKEATEESRNQSSAAQESYETVYKYYAQAAPVKSLWEIVSHYLVVVQEIILSAYLLARHDIDASLGAHNNHRLTLSAVWLWTAMLCISYFATYKSSNATVQSTRSKKVRQRFLDACWLAVILRVLAGLLRSLTASYSSDTVDRLVCLCMVLHLLSCDYTFANGYNYEAVDDNADEMNKASVQSTRPLFQGGTLSLNAALFATLLLSSRLDDNLQAYGLVMLAIVLFAFYPVSRHEIVKAYPCNEHGESVKCDLSV